VLELSDQRVERAVKHLLEVARRDDVAEQLLRVTELVMRGPPDGDLDREALWRERPNPARGAGRLRSDRLRESPSSSPRLRSRALAGAHRLSRLDKCIAGRLDRGELSRDLTAEAGAGR
jgi:hypothetical protein